MSTKFHIIPPATSQQFKKKEQNVNIKKIIVGEIDPHRPIKHGKVLMLLGATGAGKSTLINGLLNYIRGVEYKDNYRYKLIGDEGPQYQAHSQTKWITAYTFQEQTNSKLPYTFTIIDTPGYGDTSGLERDKQITKQIKEFFSIEGSQGIDQIDGIGFVVQASLARLTPTQKYIFDSIPSMFDEDISKNIFLMITFADGKKPPVLKAIQESGFEYQKYFKFNNSALYPDEDEEDHGFNGMFWNMGNQSFGNFLKDFGSTQSVSSQLTKEVKRKTLECLIQTVQMQIQAALFKVDQLHQEERILQEQEKDMETNNFTYEIEETRQRKVDLESGIYVTNCLQCNRTCHFPCQIAEDQLKYQCLAMVDQSSPDTNCRVCPGHCHWQKHVNNPYKFEIYMVKVKKSLDDLKKRYEDVKSKESEAERIMSGISAEIRNMYEVFYYKIYEAKSSIQRLDEIALRPNQLTEVQYIDLMIHSEEMEAKQGFERRVSALQKLREQAEEMADMKDKQAIIQNYKGAAIKFFETYEIMH